MTNKVILYRNGIAVGEGRDVMGTLYVHFYDKRSTFRYEYGNWPKGYKIVYER